MSMQRPVGWRGVDIADSCREACGGDTETFAERLDFRSGDDATLATSGHTISPHENVRSNESATREFRPSSIRWTFWRAWSSRLREDTVSIIQRKTCSTPALLCVMINVLLRSHRDHCRHLRNPPAIFHLTELGPLRASTVVSNARGPIAAMMRRSVLVSSSAR